MAIGSISNGEAGSSCRTKINQSLSICDGLIGVILAFGGSSAPSKWVLCDGSAISRTTYSELFSVIGTTYGNGNGTTTFNIPDLRGKIPVGKNSGTFNTLGGSVGAETHTLTEAQLPVVSNHNHEISASTSFVTQGADVNVFIDGGATATSSAGGFGSGEAHNNIQPSLVVNYIIYAGV